MVVAPTQTGGDEHIERAYELVSGSSASSTSDPGPWVGRIQRRRSERLRRRVIVSVTVGDGSTRPKISDVEIAERIFDGGTVADIAAETGLCDSSIRHYIDGTRRPAIREHIERLSRETIAKTQRRLVRAQDRAVQELERMLCESKDETIRVQCARELLRHRAAVAGDESSRPRMTAMQIVQIIQAERGRNGDGNGNGHRPQPRVIDVEPGKEVDGDGG